MHGRYVKKKPVPYLRDTGFCKHLPAKYLETGPTNILPQLTLTTLPFVAVYFTLLITLTSNK